MFDVLVPEIFTTFLHNLHLADPFLGTKYFHAGLLRTTPDFLRRTLDFVDFRSPAVHGDILHIIIVIIIIILTLLSFWGDRGRRVSK